MNDEAHQSEKTEKRESASANWLRSIRSKIPHVLVFLMILGSVLHEHETDLANINNGNQRFGEAVRQYSTFSFLDEIYSRLNSCDYKFLVVCVPKVQPCLRSIDFPGSNPICLQYETNDYSGIAGAIAMIPHLPDAIIYLLVQRWQRGGLEFSLALLFCLGTLSIIIAAVRANIFYLPGAVVGGPIAISIVFWLVQQVVSVMSLGLGYLTTFSLAAAGIAGSLQYLSLGHDLHSLSETGHKIFKDEA